MKRAVNDLDYCKEAGFQRDELQADIIKLKTCACNNAIQCEESICF